MKILLIQPKMNKRPMDTDLKTQMSTSLASKTPDGHNIDVLNENVDELNMSCCKLGNATENVSRVISFNTLKRLAVFISYRLKLKHILAYLFAAITALVVYRLLSHNIEITLKPYVIAMNVLHQSRFVFLPDLGYSEIQGLYVIGRECLGGRLFVCLFSIFTLFRLNRSKGLFNKCLRMLGYCVISILLAYFITIIRIAASIPFCNSPDFKLIHTILSLVIYFGTCLALYVFLSCKTK